MATASAIILITTGIVFGLFGYAVYRIWAAFSGFIFSLGIGAWVEAQYFPGNTWPVVVGGLCGLLVAGAFYCFRRVGVVATGTGSGFWIALLAVYALGNTNWTFAFMGAVLGGIFASFFFRAFIPIGSSFSGAAMVVSGMYIHFSKVSFHPPSLFDPFRTREVPVILLTATLLLGAIALSVQFLLLKRRERVEKDRFCYRV